MIQIRRDKDISLSKMEAESCLHKKLSCEKAIKKETAYFRLCCVKNLLMSSKLMTLKIQLVIFYQWRQREWFYLKVLSTPFLLVCFASLKDSNCKRRKYVFYFTSKASFHSLDNQILIFQIFRCHSVIKCLSMKHKTHFTFCFYSFFMRSI